MNCVSGHVLRRIIDSTLGPTYLSAATKIKKRKQVGKKCLLTDRFLVPVSSSLHIEVHTHNNKEKLRASSVLPTPHLRHVFVSVTLSPY